MTPEMQATIDAAKRWHLENRVERVALLRVLAGRELPFVAPVFSGSFQGWTLLVHRDTYEHRVGQWRVTRFDATGEAAGHCCPATFAACLYEVQDWGGDLRFARVARAGDS